MPRLVAEQIGSSAWFRCGAADLAKQLDRPEASVLQEATDKLGTFVATQSRLMCDLFDGIFQRMHERTWTVATDVDTLERLRVLNETHALVFLPSHRTYMDPFVLARVLRDHNFPANHVLGGNNMAFWPIGAIGRRAGKVFIRRKFGDDPVYRFAMRSSLSHLVDKRFNLEWYIEGGRSRTGKLRQPMYGLLSYVADAVEQRPDADVMIVPTSIVYDQLPEVAAMAAESNGGKKKAESLSCSAARSHPASRCCRMLATPWSRDCAHSCGPARHSKVHSATGDRPTRSPGWAVRPDPRCCGSAACRGDSSHSTSTLPS